MKTEMSKGLNYVTFVYQLSCLIWPEMKLVSFIMCIMHHVTLFLKNAYGYGNASCIRYQLYSLKNSHEYASRSLPLKTFKQKS